MKTNSNNTNSDTGNEKRMTLASSVTVMMEEKKSVFYGHSLPINNEDEARRFIEEKRRKYYDATHNVYAYILNNGAVARYSDDGEPQGTAGLPVFNVLKMSGATDFVIVVTRYFGGILLGAGGLVRAYSAAAKMAIDKSGFATYEMYTVYQIIVSYSDYQKLLPALEKIGVSVDNTDFLENVTVYAAIETDREMILENMISELSAGKASISVVKHEERSSRLFEGK